MSVPGQSLTEVSVLPVTDALAWVVVAVFLSGVVADWSGRRELARRLTVGAWVGFSVFWLLLIHQFALVHRSIIQTVLVVVAVPMCLYVAWTLLQGRDSLLVLSRAVALMGLIYLPFQTSAARDSTKSESRPCSSVRATYRHIGTATTTSTVWMMLRWTSANWCINSSQKTANSDHAPAVRFRASGRRSR